jgi:hypothetical protein
MRSRRRMLAASSVLAFVLASVQLSWARGPGGPPAPPATPNASQTNTISVNPLGGYWDARSGTYIFTDLGWAIDNWNATRADIASSESELKGLLETEAIVSSPAAIAAEAGKILAREGPLFGPAAVAAFGAVVASIKLDELQSEIRTLQDNIKNYKRNLDQIKNQIVKLEPTVTVTNSLLQMQVGQLVDPAAFEMPATRIYGVSTGLNASLNLSKFLNLPENQFLSLGLGGNETLARFSQSPTNGGAAVSGNTHFVTPTLDLTYLVDDTYFKAGGSVSSGHVSETSAAAGGGFDGHGYSVGGAVGHIFHLWSVWDDLYPNDIFRQLRKPQDRFWDMLSLDLNAHVGYSQWFSDGFIDSSGFASNGGGTYATFAGVSAKLYEPFRYGDGLIEPYVKVGYDNYVKYSSSALLPAQISAPAGAQVLFFDDPKNVGTFEAGVTATGVHDINVTARAYYSVFNTGNSFGGSLSLTIPLSIGVAAIPAQKPDQSRSVVTKAQPRLYN